MLELKEIQRSLPHAPQPFHDPDLPKLDCRGVPRTHFLNTVPVGLVPLINPDTSTSHPKLAPTPCVVPKPKTGPSTCLPSRPPPSPPSTPPPNISVTSPPSSRNLDTPKPPSPRSRAVEPWVPPPPPPRLPYNIPTQPRPVPRFNFLPLLESPVSPVPSVSLCSNLPHRQESLPPSLSTSPVPPPSLESIALDRTPCPSYPSLLQSGHDVESTEYSRSPLAGVSTANTPTKSSRLAKLGYSINTPTTQLFPPSPLSSAPSTGDEKDSPYGDPTCLEAELSHLWRSQSSHMDAEAETEESEAESSVVHTEAESDGESTRSVAAFSRATKASRTSVAVVTAGDDDDEGEMSLIELESGVMAFVRVPRRK